MSPSMPGPLLEGPDSPVTLVRVALEADDPLALLGLASSVISAFDPRVAAARPDLTPELPGTLSQLVDGLLSSDVPELHILAHAVGTITRDRELAEQVEQALPPLIGPDWVTNLGQARAVSAVQSTEMPGDASTIVIEMRGPGERTWCMLTGVDHNSSEVVTESFPLPFGIKEYVEHLRDEPDAAYLQHVPTDLAATRAHLEAGLWDELVTSPDQEIWPSSLPLLEHVLAQLPDGGHWDVDQEDEDDLIGELLAEFVDSPHWRWGPRSPQWTCVQMLLELHRDHLVHGVDRVSPATVEIVMTDLWHTEFLAMDPDVRDVLPEVLRAWIPFLHGRQEIPAELTEETLQAVEELVPTFRAQADAEHDLTGAFTPQLLQELSFLAGLGRRVRPTLTRATTTDPATLAALDTTPLPDEDRQLPTWPEWVAEIAEEVLDLAEPVMEKIGGIEARTALRRTMVRLLDTDPELVTRAPDRRRSAGALVVVVGAINGLVGTRGGTTIGEVQRTFGLTTPLTDRVTTLLAGLGWRDRAQARDVILHPDLVVSSRRAAVLRKG